MIETIKLHSKPFRDDVMKKKMIFTISALACSIALLSSGAHATAIAKKDSHTKLPVSYESVFNKSMNDPNVMVYYADKAYQEQNYAEAMRWMLEASSYGHEDAVENVKFLIQNNFGTLENREGVVSFLTYFANPKGDEPADSFAQLYLADYYGGDGCVWYAPEDKADCSQKKETGPMAGNDMKQSYFYYESAADQGNARASYTTGMMNLLGVGVPRNVPFALTWLRPLAEDGNIAVSYLLGSIYQLGYWVPQDKKEASKWFEAAAETKHPASLLYIAKNNESGVMSGSVSERVDSAIKAYEDVLSGVLATDVERSEAAYRLGLIYSGYSYIKDEELAKKAMYKSIEYSGETKNAFGVKAAVWLGDNIQNDNLEHAVRHYLLALEHLKELSIDEQQRHASVWEKVAHAYGRGQKDNLERDERKFSQYMNERHRVMAKSYIPDVDLNSFQGYSIFKFPG